MFRRTVRIFRSTFRGSLRAAADRMPRDGRFVRFLGRWWQPAVIVAIALADLVTTVALIGSAGGREANPIMEPFLRMGIGAFVCAKLASVAVPVAFLEWARRRRPAFVNRACTCAIVGYVILYSIGFAKVNSKVDPNFAMGLESGPSPVWLRIQATLDAENARRRAVEEDAMRSIDRIHTRPAG